MKGAEPQEFTNPYDAMTELVGTEGEADVYLESDGKRITRLLHRDAQGSWAGG
jgi:hypothetical protein